MSVEKMLKNHYVRLAILAVLAYLAYRYFVGVREGVATFISTSKTGPCLSGQTPQGCLK